MAEFTVLMPPPSSPEPTPQSILIVDDDSAVAETFSRMLKLEGYDVVTALDPEEGLVLAGRIRPSAIILDMRMPIVNGLQFLRTVRASPGLSEVPVAIVTGDYFMGEPVMNELRALGAAVRFKPLWLEDLVALARGMVTTGT
ncbi:MAG: response regulator [Vicinamibacterales bacterium]